MEIPPTHATRTNRSYPWNKKTHSEAATSTSTAHQSTYTTNTTTANLYPEISSETETETILLLEELLASNIA